jgi:hypothetical protein
MAPAMHERLRDPRAVLASTAGLDRLYRWRARMVVLHKRLGDRFPRYRLPHSAPTALMRQTSEPRAALGRHRQRMAASRVMTPVERSGPDLEDMTGALP